MKRTLIALALVAIAAHLWQGQFRPAAVDAQTLARYEVTIPKAWGKLVGFSNNNLLLESSDGLLRISVGLEALSDLQADLTRGLA